MTGRINNVGFVVSVHQKVNDTTHNIVHTRCARVVYTEIRRYCQRLTGNADLPATLLHLTPIPFIRAQWASAYRIKCNAVFTLLDAIGG